MKHIEQHFSGSDTVRDVVIGMADGLAIQGKYSATMERAILGRVFKPHNSGICHAERSDLSSEALAKEEASSKPPQRAPARSNWILHFVQNDNPGLKTCPSLTRQNHGK